MYLIPVKLELYDGWLEVSKVHEISRSKYIDITWKEITLMVSNRKIVIVE